MEKIIDVIKKLGISSTSLQNRFAAYSVIKFYKKNDVLFSENKSNSSEYIVLDGILHRYNSHDGENITTGFYLPQQVVTPHFARTVNEKSILSLQALTDSEMIEIPVEKLDELRCGHEEFRAFGQKVLEAELSRNLFNEIAYRSMEAKDLLLLFRREYPNLENLIPHSIIASFLGITNVSFSRLRGNFAKEKSLFIK
jgi:CRP-like cAMP-binding protein